MSSVIFNIMTPFEDVAMLGHGYMERADGERLWVPLPAPASEGEEIRFVIHLLDGTPAFAGTGHCIQVADQGEHVDAQVRFEALLDSLIFDERSQPVYDYIVAVRTAALQAEMDPDAQAQGAAAERDDASPDAQETRYEYHDGHGMGYTANTEAQEPGDAAADGEPAEAEQAAGHGQVLSFSQTTDPAAAPAMTVETEDEPEQVSIGWSSQEALQARPVASSGMSDTIQVSAATTRSVFGMASEILEGSSGRMGRPADQAVETVMTPSILPMATGILTRPGIALQFQPVHARGPARSASTGLFEYEPGVLPKPERPPRPAAHSRATGSAGLIMEPGLATDRPTPAVDFRGYEFDSGDGPTSVTDLDTLAQQLEREG